MVAVILPVTHNHMIEELDAHQVAPLFEWLGQLVVHHARTGVPTRMIMAERNDGRIVKDSLLQDNPNVHAHLGNSPMVFAKKRELFAI